MHKTWLFRLPSKLHTQLLARLRRLQSLPGVGQVFHSSLLLLDCRQVQEQLSDAHDGALSRVNRVLLQAHVKACSECAPVQESLHSTIDLLAELRDRPVSPPQAPKG
jgi:DNA-binding FrmR family transcriptional regulator